MDIVPRIGRSERRDLLRLARKSGDLATALRFLIVARLGLRKTNSESTLEDTPAVRGMIDKVSYLVKVL